MEGREQERERERERKREREGREGGRERETTMINFILLMIKILFIPW